MHRQALETSPAFRDHLQSALHELRDALDVVLQAVNADPAKPQDISRQFDLNKNLTWKISKIVTGEDLYAAVPNIPGAAGLKIFLDAMARHGAPPDAVERARRAARAFEEVVAVHTDDRSTLEIMVSDLLPADAQSDQQEQSRKLAYRGNSGIWGVRARAQISLNILAPNEDDRDQADLVQVAGLAGFRRLRPDARWLLFRRERWSDEDPHPAQDTVESLDPAFPADAGVPLLSDYCSAPLPRIEIVTGEGEDHYELPVGPVGNTAALTCLYGQVSRRVGPVFGAHPGEFSEIGCNLITPAEHLVLDLFVHRELPWAMDPDVVVYSRIDGGPMHQSARRERNVMAVPVDVRALGSRLAGLNTPAFRRYSALAADVFGRVGWNPADFLAFRFALTYPPIPAVALLRSELPVR